MTVTLLTISSDGQAIDSTWDVVAVDVITEVNRVPRATLIFVDGEIASQTFPIADSGKFAPGKLVEIKVRAGDGPEARLFKGLVFRVGLDVVGRRLTVEMKDKAIRLTQGRRSTVFPDLSDGDAIGRIIVDAELSKGSIPQTAPKHESLVQYNATDWDFIVSRADVHGLVVVVDDGTISLMPMKVSGAAARRFTLDADVLDVALELDASLQHPSIESVGWDAKRKDVTTAARAAPVSLQQGTLTPTQAGEAIGLGTGTLRHLAPVPQEELQAWADGRMKRTRLAMIRGRVRVAAATDVKPMDVVELSGFGRMYDGKALATGLRYRFTLENGWRTDVQLGLPATPFAQEPDIIDTDSGGLLPAVRGLQLGIVSAYKDDPELRVKVIVPAIGSSNADAIWARLAGPDAGNERGYFFRPEEGDEVIVGFLNSDPRQAVILGGLFGAKNKAPKPFASLSAENIDKGIVSKTGVTIAIADNDKPTLTLKTPGGQLLINDKQETVELSDQHGNKITFGKDGVVITSKKDLTLDAAGGNVKISGAAVDVA